MHHRRAGIMLVGFTFAICGLVGGCQSTPSFGSILARHGTSPANPKAADPQLVLSPGMEVEWHVKTARPTPNLVDSGLSIVGPDGAIELGPYGACRIGGMPLAQASTALEKHLGKYVHSPKVQITNLASAPAAGELAWRKSAAPAPVVLAQGAPGRPTPGKTGGPVFAASFQQTTGTGDKKDVELIGPPRAVGSPGSPVPMIVGAPPVPAFVTGPLPAPPAPNECRPALLPPYVIGPTDVLLIESLEGLKTQAVRGPHLVGPDGTVRVGMYGAAMVAGLTLDQARVAIAEVIHSRLKQDEVKLDDVLKGVSVDVLAYNSKQFFIIADGGGQGDQVITLPITGNDTVLNAMSKINGVPLIGSKHHIWVARLTCPGCPETRLPVDWIGITKRGEGTTNWQLLPGDRIYVQADGFYAADRWLGKMLAPVERVMGAILLGSQTVNSIRSGSVGGNR
jgi:protein involved in polysaccharide export with SLBB domain